MKLLEPEWMDENDAMDAIKAARHCSNLFVLECYLDAAREAGVPARSGEVERIAFLAWLKSAFLNGAGKPGRPRRWKWDEAIAAAEEYVLDHGLPATQARLEEFVADWVSRNDDGGGSPDERDVRKWTGPVYRRLKGGN